MKESQLNMKERKQDGMKVLLLSTGILLSILGSGFFLTNSWSFSLEGQEAPVLIRGEEKRLLPLLVKDQTSRSPSFSLTISDSNITSAINKAFQKENISVSQLEIHTTDGIVRLAGTLGNILAKEKAVRIAGTIKGVRLLLTKFASNPHDHS